jgi:hypothetical protein
VDRRAWFQLDLAHHGYGIPFDDGFGSEVESTPDYDDVIVNAAVDAGTATDHHDRLVRRFAFCQSVIAEDAQVDTVAAEAFPNALHALSILLPAFLARLLDALAPFLASFTDAFATLLAKFGGVPAEIVVASLAGRLCPRERRGKYQCKRGNPSSH